MKSPGRISPNHEHGVRTGLCCMGGGSSKMAGYPEIHHWVWTNCTELVTTLLLKLFWATSLERSWMYPADSTWTELFPLPSPDILDAIMNPLLNAECILTLGNQQQGQEQLWSFKELDFNNMLCNVPAPLTTFVSSGEVLTFSEPQFWYLKTRHNITTNL